jgi:phage terminase small subunit
MKDHYGSSLELMQHSYNNPLLPPGLRFEAAKQALPYEHGRIGEKGKKEDKKDRAKDVAKGRFGTKQPPTASRATH